MPLDVTMSYKERVGRIGVYSRDNFRLKYSNVSTILYYVR